MCNSQQLNWAINNRAIGFMRLVRISAPLQFPRNRAKLAN
jgi:hypothetical protein